MKFVTEKRAKRELRERSAYVKRSKVYRKVTHCFEDLANFSLRGDVIT